MSRSSSAQHAQRINEAVELLQQEKAPSEVAKALVDRHGLSKRQAYRYVRRARELGERVAIPERKIAFTAKLSRKLIGRVREHARRTGQSLSEVVTRALEAFLFKRGDRG